MKNPHTIFFFLLLLWAPLNLSGIAAVPISGHGNSSSIIDFTEIAKQVQDEQPVAFFTAEPRTGYAPLTIQFLNGSTGEINTCYWDFGDGKTGTANSPLHTYVIADTYTVSLTIDGEMGSDTQTRQNYIIVLGPVPDANFTATPLTGNVPLTVGFSNTSTGSIDSVLWNFGDGTESDQYNPVHTYQDTGRYTVALTVAGASGIDTRTKMDYVTVLPPAPLAAFSATPLQGEVPLTVQFNSTSTGAVDTWLWEFGDGQTSSTENPQHEYTYADTFTVALTVTGPGGTDALLKTNLVQACYATGIANKEIKTGDAFELLQNYPNPFNPQTTITYTISKQEHVNLVVFNALGETVATLVNENQSPGIYKTEFYANQLPSGLYFYQLKTESRTKQGTMLLLR